jgi:hypothetical protein
MTFTENWGRGPFVMAQDKKYNSRRGISVFALAFVIRLHPSSPPPFSSVITCQMCINDH